MLTLEACKALAGLGYPQDHYPMLRCEIVPCIAGCSAHCEHEMPILVPAAGEMPGPEQYACPDSAEALEWLAYRLGWSWQYSGLYWFAKGWDKPHTAYPSPSHLIVAAAVYVRP